MPFSDVVALFSELDDAIDLSSVLGSLGQRPPLAAAADCVSLKSTFYAFLR